MIKLFCIPGGAASATAYLPWVKLLDKDVKLCLLEIPGRGLRRKEESRAHMAEVADDLFSNLQSQLKDGEDYMVLGYCFGAVAGYELYRRIAESGTKLPSRMFFCASDPPDGNTYKTSIFTDRAREDELKETLTRYFHPSLFEGPEDLAAFAGKYTQLCYESYERAGQVVAVRPEEIFADYAGNEERYFEKSKALEFANHTMDLLDIDQKIVQEYQNSPQDYFRIEAPVTVFAGDRDTMTTLEAVSGWSRMAGGAFDLRVIDGGPLILIDGYQNCIPIINDLARAWEASRA